MIITSAETNTAEMDIGTKVADGARGTVIIIETALETVIETAIETVIVIPEADTENLAKVTAKRYSVQRHGLLICSSLGTPFVSFDRARDSISRGSRQSKRSSIGSRQTRSSSRHSSINSISNHSSHSRSSSVDSSEVSVLYSYSTVSYLPSYCGARQRCQR